MRFLLLIIFFDLMFFSCAKKTEDESLFEETPVDNVTKEVGPYNLKYSNPDAVYMVNEQITINAPSYLGNPAEFSISPHLPVGLNFSSAGVITGTPEYSTDRLRYVVTAKNSGGIAVYEMYIKIKPEPPESITYPTNTYSSFREQYFNRIEPIIVGDFDAISISPDLPEGLVFENGAIYGTPTEDLHNTNFTITISNESGSASTNLNIEIKGYAPSNLSYLYEPLVVKSGKDIKFNYPIYSGDQSTFSISPSLPEGLYMENGIIKGTTGSIFSNLEFQVTITNDWGETMTNLNISSIPYISSIRTGEKHTCYIKNRELYCFGDNLYGQLGYLATECDNDCSSYPHKVLKIDNSYFKAKDLAISSNTTCAIDLNNQVFCFGDNSLGELGHNVDTSNSNAPLAVKKSDGSDLFAKEISAGLHFFCAKDLNNQVFCWGDNSYKQIVNSLDSYFRYARFTISDVDKIDVGSDFLCYSKISENGLFCSGSNRNLLIGSSEFISEMKKDNSSIDNLVSADNMVIFNDLVFGKNINGEAIVNSNNEQQYPVHMLKDASTNLDVSNIESFGYNNGNTCYIEDSLYCTGSMFSNLLPLQVMNSENVTEVSRGFFNHLCYSINENIYCAGSNDRGQLGNGTFDDSTFSHL